MTAPLLAVDTPSMLFRAFYALPKTIVGPDGKPVNALLGAANLILREVETAPAARGRPLLRARRRRLPDRALPRLPRRARGGDARRALPPQFADCRDFFEAFGWTVAASDDLEADDLLGTYAKREAEAGGRALLLTGDRDMYQCADRRGHGALRPHRRQRRRSRSARTEVRERYGIGPELVPDFIALRGDPSDGLPGAKGVGPKTAAELLREHGSLEAILDNAIRERRPRNCAAP